MTSESGKSIRLLVDADVSSIFAAEAERHPQWPDVQNRWGLLLLLSGRPDEALAAFERALGVNPGYPWACLNRAQALALTGRTDRARARLEESPDPGLGARDVAMASLPLLDSSIPVDRIPDFPEEISRRPDVLRLIGALQERHRPGSGRESLEASRRAYAAGGDATVRLDVDGVAAEPAGLLWVPGLHRLFLDAAGLEGRLGRWDEAECSVRTAAYLWWDLGAVLHQRGFLASFRGDEDEAVEFWSRAEREVGHDPSSSISLAYHWSARGNLDRAEASLREALRRAPRYADLHYQFGLILRAREEREEALAEFRSALALNPNYTMARLEEAETLYAQERWLDAREGYTAVVNSGIDSSDIRIRMGRIEEILGNDDGAARAYRAAGRLNPKDPEPHYLLGRLCRRDGDRPGARKAWGRFLDLERDPVRQAAVRSELEDLDS